MKNSNKLLLAALLLLIAFLATYNISLRAEYQKGTYKDQESYKNFDSLNFKNFNAISINGASRISVKIMKGPYQVRVDHNATEYIKFKQAGSWLKLDLDLYKDMRFFGGTNQVVISLPEIKELQVNSVYTQEGKQITDKVKFQGLFQYRVLVEGFVQDNLSLKQDNASIVNLAGIKLNKLQVVSGLAPGSVSELNIFKGTIISEADLNIRNKSQLLLDNVQISNLKYYFADSARVTLVGASLNILKQDKNQ